MGTDTISLKYGTNFVGCIRVEQCEFVWRTATWRATMLSLEWSDAYRPPRRQQHHRQKCYSTVVCPSLSPRYNWPFPIVLDATASHHDSRLRLLIKISVFDLFVSSWSLRTYSRLSGRSPGESLVARRYFDHIDHPAVTFFSSLFSNTSLCCSSLTLPGQLWAS